MLSTQTGRGGRGWGKQLTREYKFRGKGRSGVAEQMPDVETLKSFNTGLVEEFRANGGKVGGKYQGANLLLLTTTGAKTGQPRVTPLAYFRFDGKLIIVGSSWGAQSHPAWVRNLWANPSVHVEVGTETFDATARELSAAERERVWTHVVATAPVFGEYQSRTDRVIPLFELQRHQA